MRRRMGSMPDMPDDVVNHGVVMRDVVRHRAVDHMMRHRAVHDGMIMRGGRMHCRCRMNRGRMPALRMRLGQRRRHGGSHCDRY
jgi:hypothetical protein